MVTEKVEEHLTFDGVQWILTNLLKILEVIPDAALLLEKQVNAVPTMLSSVFI